MSTLRIRTEREAKDGWTQLYVGNMVGLTDKAICLIEAGKRKPSYDVLCKLETLFGMSHEKLFEQVRKDDTDDELQQG